MTLYSLWNKFNENKFVKKVFKISIRKTVFTINLESFLKVFIFINNVHFTVSPINFIHK